MRVIRLAAWVTQFGFSAVFPLCASLLLGSWLQTTYDLGMWVVALCGILGFLTSVSTVRSCLQAMRKDMGLQKGDGDTPAAFNDHE